MSEKNKDPAFLFYSADFLIGVADLDMQERGQYITLLALQHQKGHLSEKTIRLSLGCGLESVSDSVMQKFAIDTTGCLYNERLEKEMQIRAKFTDSRRKNGAKGGRPTKEKAQENLMVIDSLRDSLSVAEATNNHGVNENENVNEDENIDGDESVDIEIQRKADKIKEIISYLNERTGCAYRPTVDATIRKISARLNEGFTVIDFKTVIDKKVSDWNREPRPGEKDMRQYLRPETLFGTKFEGYLNAIGGSTDDDDVTVDGITI